MTSPSAPTASARRSRPRPSRPRRSRGRSSSTTSSIAASPRCASASRSSSDCAARRLGAKRRSWPKPPARGSSRPSNVNPQIMIGQIMTGPNGTRPKSRPSGSATARPSASPCSCARFIASPPTPRPFPARRLPNFLRCASFSPGSRTTRPPGASRKPLGKPPRRSRPWREDPVLGRPNTPIPNDPVLNVQAPVAPPDRRSLQAPPRRTASRGPAPATNPHEKHGRRRRRPPEL